MFKFVLLYASLYAAFNVAGAAAIKSKLVSHKIGTVGEFVPFLLDIKIIAAMGLIFVSMFFSIKALSLSSFSSVIPILTAINFLVTVTVGVLFFRDKLTLSSYAGITMILVGVFLLGRGGLD